MMRPLNEGERRLFIKDMFQEEASKKALSYKKMSINKLFKLVTKKNEFPALIPLFIAEKAEKLSADEYAQLDHLTMEAVDAIECDENKALKRAFWQIQNNIR